MKKLSFKTLIFLLITVFTLCLGNRVATAQSPFITRWNLATGGSGANQLSFNVVTSGLVSYTWQQVAPGTAYGTGTFTGSNNNLITITGLPTGATIDLSIDPTNFQQIIILGGPDARRLTDVKQWGTTAWSSMESAFYG